MNTGKAELTSIIDVPASRVYSILADYRQGHPAILPRKYFRRADVEAGGTGAGTSLNIEMKVLGTVKSFRHVVSEPQPGRVLVESNRVEADPAAQSVTTFTVDPINGGQQAQVTISTALSVANWLEGLFTTMFLRRVYAQELKQIAALAEEDAADLSVKSARAFRHGAGRFLEYGLFARFCQFSFYPPPRV